MFIYLGDNDSVFEAALREDSSVRAYYESLPGMLREKVRAAGLYSAPGDRRIYRYADSRRKLTRTHHAPPYTR